MRSYRSLIIVFALAATCALAEKARFDNYRVYSLTIANFEQLQTLKELENHGDGYQFWQSPVQINMKVDLMVPPHKFSDFGELVAGLGMDSTLKIFDLQTLIDNEQPKVQPREFGWTSYHRLGAIYSWMDDLLAANPGKLTGFVAGQSHEGHEIRGIKLSQKAGNKGIYIESNIHAREWITSATSTWILNQLLTSSDPKVRAMAEDYDWYFVPVMNPDGLEYSHETNRMWRKTRYPHTASCYGADPNRNWGYKWNQGGASNNACSDTFAGPKAFSEIECRSTADYYMSIKKDISVYLAFHSYGLYFLMPWGDTTERVDNYDDLKQIGTKAAQSVAQRYGTTYKVGSTAEILYIASGTASDWAKGAAETPVSFTLEFRDEGKYGFVLPADQIIPNAEETLDGLVTLVAETKSLGYFN